jgi:hypothetical protein
MNPTPLISVVTPCYNSARYIGRCVESVLSQDYAPVEHVIQDGGSRDGTVEVLRRYGDRVKWVSERDGGQSDGLNRALQRCTGEIIGVLNADDEYLPGALSWAAEAMARHPEAAAVYGDQYDIDEEGRTLHEYLGKPYDFVKVLSCEHVIPAQAAFIRRRHFEQVGFYADVTRKTCPDYEMWVRIGLRFPVVHESRFVAGYRWHAGSEGRQDTMIPKMVASKLEVAQKALGDPATPESIRALRGRAVSGIIWWGGCCHLWQGDAYRATTEVARSVMIWPSLGQFSRLRHFLRGLRGPCNRHRRFWNVSANVALLMVNFSERFLRCAGIAAKDYCGE